MELVGVLVGLLAGLVAGGAAGSLPAVLARRRQSPPSTPPPTLREPAEPSSADVVAALPVAVVVVDAADDVVLANPPAVDLGLVRGPLLMLPDVRRLVRDTRRSRLPRDAGVDLPNGPRGPAVLRARTAPLGDEGHVAVLAEDVSEARRLEAVRRDFVVNVSHELKTPVGALALLAEALGDAADDPEAVRRFAGRVGAESARLARLVQEIVELSRLQGADPMPERKPVSVDRVVAEALDRTRTLAAASDIELVSGGRPGLTVRGVEEQLVTAVGNLLSNAVHYSPAGTRVAVGVRLREGTVEIGVTDQGIGIAPDDVGRVFERFYRADPARSRATGGTGLGLAIVKHVATNHGGDVTVWSVEGHGSTFTLRLPAAVGAEQRGTA